MKYMIQVKIFFFLMIVFSFIITGCKDNPTQPADNEPTTDQGAFEQLADEDSSLASFDGNYNEDNLSDFLGKTTQEIYPFRFGHKAKLISRHLDYTITGDTARAQLVKNYLDTLIIAASYTSGTNTPDTIIKKGYTSTVGRNLIFVRTGNSNRPYRNWRLAAISLPLGHTPDYESNIAIQSIHIVTPNDTLTINDPLNYFLSRGKGWWRALPVVPKDSEIAMNIQLYSASADTDLVYLSWGGDWHGMNRVKKRFNLVSSIPSGTGYVKIYQQVFSSRSNAGFSHAVINAYPWIALHDDASVVKNVSWGFPYFVRKN